MNLERIQHELDMAYGAHMRGEYGMDLVAFKRLHEALSMLVKELAENEPKHKEPSIEIMGVVPPEIILKAMEVEMWMKQNGHANWKLGGIQSVEEGETMLTVQQCQLLAEAHKQIMAIHWRLSVGCGNHGCRLSKPRGQAANGSCSCAPKQFARELRYIAEMLESYP